MKTEDGRNYSGSSLLTVVAYHYVRPLSQSAFPRLKALDLMDFCGQLDHLHANYSVIGHRDLHQVLHDGKELPPHACVLTFDDGYRDHYQYVFPELLRRGLSGLFFAPRMSMLDRKVLEVNKIQFVLASVQSPAKLADELDDLLCKHQLGDPQNLRKTHMQANRYDSAKVSYFKRVLQHALPSSARSQLVDILFERHVNEDVNDFGDDLYLTVEEARHMRAEGMEFGGHGDQHLWHGLATEEELAKEIAGSVSTLEAIGAPVRAGYYCYPFGSQSSSARSSIVAAGFKTGFTVLPKLHDVHRGCPLQVSRLDTNDLPKINAAESFEGLIAADVVRSKI